MLKQFERLAPDGIEGGRKQRTKECRQLLETQKGNKIVFSPQASLHECIAGTTLIIGQKYLHQNSD